MTNKKIKSGDVFILSDVTIGQETLFIKNKIRLGKIIFLSKIFQRTIGIILSYDTFSEIPNNINEIRFTNTVFYTGNQLLKNGSWEIIGNQIVTGEEEELTLRIVGCSLYKLDTELGVVSNEYREKYPKQLIYGFSALYLVINQLNDTPDGARL